jgi:hypothetical protein
MAKNKGPKPYRVVLIDPEGVEHPQGAYAKYEHAHAEGTGIIRTRGHLLKGATLRIYKDSEKLKDQRL